MLYVNLALWSAVFGIAMRNPSDSILMWTAVAGLVFAACWEHSVRRGFFRPKTPPKNQTHP
jgi:hypothetical protein